MGKATKPTARILIQRPKAGQRAAFCLSWDYRRLNNGQKYQKLSDPIIDAINEQFKKSQISVDEAIKQIEDFRIRKYKEIFKESALIYNGHNQKIATEYFETEIQPKHITSKDVTKQELQNAVDILGIHSLRTISAQELQTIVDYLPAHKQRRVVMRLLSLLKFIGRSDVRIHKKPEAERVFKYLTETELQLIIDQVDNEHCKHMYRLAFNTGCRYSEIMGLRPDDLLIKNNETVLYLQRQKVSKRRADASGERVRLPKNRKKRFIVPLIKSQFLESFNYWMQVPDSEKDSLLHIASATLKKLCIENFLNERAHCSIHKLRASHAIALLGMGASATQGAAQLGNSIKVFEKHYSSFITSDNQLSLLQKTLR